MFGDGSRLACTALPFTFHHYNIVGQESSWHLWINEGQWGNGAVFALCFSPAQHWDGVSMRPRWKFIHASRLLSMVLGKSGRQDEWMSDVSALCRCYFGLSRTRLCVPANCS